MRSRLFGLAWLLVLALPGFLYAQQKPRFGVVAKLATTNPPPVIRGEPGEEEADFGGKRDAKESERVRAVVAEVVRDAETLWPELIDHLGDDRYSRTAGIDAGYPTNWSVGDVCLNTIGQTLAEPYYRHFGGDKQNYHKFHMPAVAQDKAKLRQWCLARKDQKLYQLQIECCRWAIAEIQTSNMSADEKTRLKGAIEKEIEALEKSKTAVLMTKSFG